MASAPRPQTRNLHTHRVGFSGIGGGIQRTISLAAWVTHCPNDEGGSGPRHRGGWRLETGLVPVCWSIRTRTHDYNSLTLETSVLALAWTEGLGRSLVWGFETSRSNCTVVRDVRMAAVIRTDKIVTGPLRWLVPWRCGSLALVHKMHTTGWERQAISSVGSVPQCCTHIHIHTWTHTCVYTYLTQCGVDDSGRFSFSCLCESESRSSKPILPSRVVKRNRPVEAVHSEEMHSVCIMGYIGEHRVSDVLCIEYTSKLCTYRRRYLHVVGGYLVKR